MVNDEITEKIISCAFTVMNTLGTGFLEKVYENSLVIELENNGFKVNQQVSIPVYYKNKPVGDYIADLIVNDSIIIELKAVEEINAVHKAQVINYLKATNHKIGLLINFGKAKVEVKRLYL